MQPRVRTAPPTDADRAEFIEAMARSRGLHDPWVHPATTDEAYDELLERQAGPTFEGFLIRQVDDDALVGFCNLSNIFRRDLQSAFLGFAAVEGFQGRGLMKEGLGLVLDDAFGRLGLHRVEANVQPDNLPSRRLVERLGFVREGFSEDYLKVGGQWRDHERWAIRVEIRTAAIGGRG